VRATNWAKRLFRTERHEVKVPILGTSYGSTPESTSISATLARVESLEDQPFRLVVEMSIDEAESFGRRLVQQAEEARDFFLRPKNESVWVNVVDGRWFEVKSVGETSVIWSVVQGDGVGSMPLREWIASVKALRLAPKFSVHPNERDSIRHTPTGVHPGSCRGCDADPRTWGKPVVS
jgi:hypothetical protein